MQMPVAQGYHQCGSGAAWHLLPLLPKSDLLDGVNNGHMKKKLQILINRAEKGETTQEQFEQQLGNLGANGQDVPILTFGAAKSSGM